MSPSLRAPWKLAGSVLSLALLTSCAVEYTVPLRDADCLEGRSACGNACIDLDHDDLHCGACDEACGEDRRCSEGVCVPQCPAGLVPCDDRCVDVAQDESHCGGCGNRCDDGWCSDGRCEERCQHLCDETREVCDASGCSCRPGLLLCDGECIDPAGDPRHCGSCGTPCEGPCGAAECRDESCAGFVTRCGGTCTNLEDVLHCGACQESCDADEACIEGECEDVDDDDDDDD